MSQRVEASGYCRHCKRDVVVWRPSLATAHALLTLLTCGAYLLVLPLFHVAGSRWKCSQCGRRASRRAFG